MVQRQSKGRRPDSSHAGLKAYFLGGSRTCLVYKTSEYGKCRSVFPKASDNVHKCLVLSTSSGHRSVHN